MRMRLIRQQDRERQGIGFNQIESPFFAESMVRQALLSRRDGKPSLPKAEPVASSLPQERSKMAQQFAFKARATEVNPYDPAALTTITVNDRAATRETIIRLVRILRIKTQLMQPPSS